MSVLAGVARVVVVHAHPDDETLATGALLAHLARTGVEVHVVTATRGERGGVVAGVPAGDPGTDSYSAQREQELACALVQLGVHHHAFLGAPPARAPGQPPRVYRDSGMAWLTPQLAGPVTDAGPQALTAASVTEAAADLSAYVTQIDPDLLLTYDASGGYGHPDHVRMHAVVAASAEETGVAMAEFLGPQVAGDLETLDADRDTEHLDLVGEYPAVAAALRCHKTQLVLEGTDVVHQGGQREPMLLSATLRPVSTSREG
ncbi:MAG: PIG-L deacetylase family protein [Nostocoides sp.]